MRFPIVLPLALVACTEAAPDTLAHRSTMSRSTFGVALHDDGETGHAGMSSLNCPFETANGTVTGDADLPGEGEEVQDVGPTLLGEASVLLVLRNEQQVFLIEKQPSGEYAELATNVPGIREARLTAGGMVAMRRTDDACELTWFQGQDVSTGLGVAACDDVGFDVDSRTGMAVIGTATGVSIATPDGLVATGEVGTRVAWDPDTDAIYAAAPQGTRVAALEPDGALRWAVEIDGPIVGLDAAGAPGGVVLSIGADDGTGWFVLLDADTGAEVSRVETPAPAEDVVSSADGSVVALVTPDAVHFYGLLR